MYLHNIKSISVANPTIFSGYHETAGHIRIEYNNHIISFYKHENEEAFYTRKVKTFPHDNYVTWDMIGYIVETIDVEKHQMKKSWWDQNLNTKHTIAEFESWVGTYNIPSKTFIRNYIIRKKYKNVLDCGCGLCSMYFGFKAENREINYTGIDSSQVLVTKAQGLQVPVQQASIEDIPFKDNSFDVTYARHVLEHLPYYVQALHEMIRVAKKEVIVVFFLRPRKGYDDLIELRDGLHFNIYGQDGIIGAISAHHKVKSYHWSTIGTDTILQINL